MRDGFKVVGDAGRGLVMSDHDRLDGGILVERGLDGGWVGGLAPFVFESCYISAVGLGDIGQPVAENTY
jgi:hypothetical protein